MQDKDKRGRADRRNAHGRPRTERTVVGYIFRPYRELPDGRLLWARNYGLKAWRIPVYSDDPNIIEQES